jgi:transcriptional regulator with XRE-family HTH domain
MSARESNQVRYVTDPIRDHGSGLHYPADMPAEDETPAAESEHLRAFGDVIKKAREGFGWTQDDLAEAASVSRPTINRYEQGKTRVPEPGQTRRIFQALKLDPRRIPLVLGYVSAEEMGLPAEPLRNFDDLTETAIRILEDPTVSAEEKQDWIEYLQFRMQRHRAKRSAAG